MIKYKTKMEYFKTLIIVGTLISSVIIKNVSAAENYIVTLVNNLPITKIDIVDRAKIISYSVNQDVNFNNLHKFYDKSLKSLINDNIKRYAGLEFNKNIIKLVKKQAYSMALSDYQNSEKKLNQFVDKLSISKASIVNQYETKVIWKIILQNQFKQQLINIDKETKKIVELDLLEKSKDKYDLAEIIISNKNNLKLFNRIMLALKKGDSFTKIAEEVSISPSAKFGGKIGWKSFKELPNNITKNTTQIKEGDLFNFIIGDTIKIIKVLVKRNKGKVSLLEKKILLAEINFQINFGNKDQIYTELKNKLTLLFKNNKRCEVLKNISNQIKNLKLNVINARVADLDITLQNGLKNLKLFEYIGPIYRGNNGFLYIFCDKKNIKLKKINPGLIKKKILNKRFVVLSTKLFKKLTQKADIKTINQID